MSDRFALTIGQIGSIDLAQLENSIGLANQVQTTFRFDLITKRNPISRRRYRLPNGGYDLDLAVKNLARTGRIKSPIALFTGLPYGDRDKAKEKDWFYFADYALTSDPGLAIISTYLWEHLPGNRRLQPYILLSLAVLTLSTFAGLEEHEETRSCLFDYCDEPENADRCFHGKGLCPSCEQVLQAKVRSDVISIAQVASARRLFLRAAGRHSCFVIMPFDRQLKPVYDRVRRSLEDLGWEVTRADEMTHPRRIIDAITEAILTSDLVLADLTGNNPNVFYELGMAHALGKDVIFLTQERKLPFDVAPERAVFYKASERSLHEMEEKLKHLSGARLTRP